MTTAVRDHWWELAACAGKNPDWWQGDQNRSMLGVAVATCMGCPVRDPCLAEAMAVRDSGVVRGGMLLTLPRGGDYQIISLVCSACGTRPVEIKQSGRLPELCLGCRGASSSHGRPSLNPPNDRLDRSPAVHNRQHASPNLPRPQRMALGGRP